MEELAWEKTSDRRLMNENVGEVEKPERTLQAAVMKPMSQRGAWMRRRLNV
jgi:hypothetical protein